MKKNRKLYRFLIITFSFFIISSFLSFSTTQLNVRSNSAIPNQESKVPKSSATKEWTFMIYLDADCNLEEAGIDDINEMETEGSDTNINIVVQMDRISDYDESNGDWTGARRYYVTSDYSTSSIGSTLIQDLGEVNMGSEITLSNFVSWSKSNYPAKKYCLVLWDHGSGIMAGSYPGGVCWDDTNSYDYLTMSEIRSALTAYPVDLLCSDACLMGSTEIFYGLKDYADVIVASEELVPGDGYPYDDILDYLRKNPTISAQTLGKVIVDRFDAFYAGTGASVTMSAVSALNSQFSTDLTAFISDLNSALDSQKTQISAARTSSLEFDEVSFIDFIDFIEEVKNRCSGEVVTSAQTLMNTITALIIEEKHSTSLSGANGMSVYFPRSLSSYSTAYESSSFATDFNWDEFLLKYYTGTTTGKYEDQFEENDDSTQAATITAGSYYSLILNGTDDDWYKISTTSGQPLEINVLFSHSKGDIDVGLYDPEGSLVDSGESTSDNEEIDYTVLESGNYLLLITQSGETQLHQPYDLIIDDGTDDSYEPNDDFNSASDINTGTTYTNLVCRDDDFYKFQATAGLLIDIQIQFDYTDGDLDLALYDSVGNLLQESATATDNEQVLYGAREEDPYYVIKISYNRDDNSNYRLLVSTRDVDDSFEKNNDFEFAKPISFGPITNLVCINPDFYYISLVKDEWINITLEFLNDNGDIDMYLYKIVTEDTQAYAYEEGFGISYTDDEFIYYKPQETGDYYIEVDPYEINLEYDLIISRAPGLEDDLYEENDDFSNAAKLNSGYEYQQLVALDWDVFYFTAVSGYTYTITLDSQQGDLDLFLLDVSESSLEILTYSATYESQESLSYFISESGDYYILVYVDRIAKNYTLTLLETQGGGGDGFEGEIDAYPIFPMSLISILAISIILWKRLKKTSIK